MEWLFIIYVIGFIVTFFVAFFKEGEEKVLQSLGLAFLWFIAIPAMLFYVYHVNRSKGVKS
jgi:hypothetical protein